MKMNLLKKALLSLLLLTLVFSCFAMLVSANSESKAPIVDDADFLSDKQEEELLETIDRINQKYGISVMIYFTRDKYPVSLDEEDLLDRLYYDSERIFKSMRTDGDAILYYMSLDGGYRDYYFFRTGECYEALEDGMEVNLLKEHAEKYMTKNDFYGAATEFLRITDEAMKKHTEGGSIVSKIDVLIEYLPLVIFVSLIIALIAVLIMKSQMRSVRAKENAHMYAKRDSFNVKHAADIFLFRTVSRRPRPQNNSSGGSGGGGGSRGGGGRC